MIEMVGEREFFETRILRKAEVLRNTDCHKRKRAMAKNEGKWEACKV